MRSHQGYVRSGLAAQNLAPRPARFAFLLLLAASVQPLNALQAGANPAQGNPEDAAQASTAAPAALTPIQPAVPFWANQGRISYGVSVADQYQNPIPPNGSHINLLYLQPELHVILGDFQRSPVSRIEWLSAGALGGATHPGGRLIGYSLLFRLEGRAHRNTLPIMDFGAGVNDTTLNQRAYEIAGPLQFTPQGGFGIEHFFSPQHAVVVECRYLHMSNAGIQEPNHGFNTIGLTVGFRWLRRPRGSSWR